MDHDYEKLAEQVLVNPRIVAPFNPFYFSPLKVSLLPEDWIEANDRLIQEMGASTWLWRLLRILQNEPTEDLTDILMNPRQAVLFSDYLRETEIPVLMNSEDWVSGNMNSMNRLGTGDWLRLLLRVLEHDGTKNN